MLSCVAAGLTNTGQVRQQNEDRYFVDESLGVFIVADGMGGHAAGEIAAQIMVKVLPNLIHKRLRPYHDIAAPAAKQIILKLLQEFSNRLRDESARRIHLMGMGSTVMVLVIRNTRALFAYLGDSRIYLLRAGKLKLLSHDHSLVQLLLDAHEITPKEAANHAARGQITRYMGMPGQPLPDALAFNLLEYDRLLLCSDGLSDMVDCRQLKTILTEPLPPQPTCQRLIDAANLAGGRDNITAVVVDVLCPDHAIAE